MAVKQAQTLILGSGRRGRLLAWHMSAVPRTEATEKHQGFMKALVGADDCIAGFTMAGSEAGELVGAVPTAVLANMPCPPLRDAVIAHQTIVERLGLMVPNTPPRLTTA